MNLRLTAVLLILILAPGVRAEHSAGGGSGTLSIAAGELIYTVIPIPGGINGQVLIRRLAADGGVFWEQRWGRSRAEESTAIATMHDGGVVVAGEYKGGCFAVRFDAQGRWVWEAAPVTTGTCRPAGVVSDGDGSVYLLATVSAPGGFEARVWKLLPRGDMDWSHRYAQSESVYAQNLYLDPRGDRLRAFVLRKNGLEFVEEFFRLDLAGRRL